MASKRKAQDVSSLRPASVPTGHQSKGRSAAARIADNDDDDNDDDPETAPNRPVKRTRKASTMAKQAGWNQAGELGSHGSRKATTIEQHLMEQNTKSKEFVQAFREEVQEGQEKLAQELGRLRHGLDEAHADQIQELLTSSGALETVTATPSSSSLVEDHALHQQTQQLIRLCRSMLNCHENAEKAFQRPGLVNPQARWKQDEKKMAELLRCGRHYGEKLVEGLLSPEEGTPAGDIEGEEGLVAEMFEKSSRAVEEEGWGPIAQAQLKALTSIMRTVPGSGKR